MSIEPGIVDTNVLVYALDADAPHHAAARALLKGAREASSTLFEVRPDGAYHQWRKDPSRELSIALVADERFGRVTGWIEAS
jgi:hypothetical protein